MTRSSTFLAALGPALLALAPAVGADTIRRTDGKAIEDVRVQSETLKEVLYKKGSREESVPSEQVLSITFERMPGLVESGINALEDGDFAQAESDLDAFVEQHLAGEDVTEGKGWAPAFAAYKVLEARLTMGDLPGAVAAANRLLASFPDSRYVPVTYLSKSDALAWQGKRDEAKKTLEDFRSLIDSKGLPARWGLECDLGLVIHDTGLRGQARRDRLEVIQSKAGANHPTVRSRAQVAIGQSYLDEVAEERDAQKKLAAVGEARPIFEEIREEFKADDATLAGAYVGLGDCLWIEATAGNKDQTKLEDAQKWYLRVPILYGGQSSYVPKAWFMGGLCSWELAELTRDEAERERAFVLFGRLIREYPTSPFAEQAKRYR